MAYRNYIYKFKNVNEYEYKFAGNYGRKGEKRNERRRATPAEVIIQNLINKSNKYRRLIIANFDPDIDYFATLTYEKGTRKTLEEVKDDVSKFLDKMRYQYKRVGEEFKFLYTIEIGKQGGIHAHIILNRARGTPTDILMAKKWTHGHVYYELLYEKGNFEQLGAYVAKLPDEDERKEMKEQEKNGTWKKVELKRIVSTSRNLVRPVPEKHIYYRRTVERIIRDGPKPTEGYYIDRDTVKQGINKFTGMSYLYYTEVRIKRRE